MDTDGGWLFLGKDGVLYRARYDSDHYTTWDLEDYPHANGWEVAHVRIEYWAGEFPEFMPDVD